MQFRPTLWATIVVIPMLAVLIGLGVWQLQRLDWKEELIALRVERITAPPIDLVPRNRVERLTDPGQFELRLAPDKGVAMLSDDPESFEYRPIRLAGTFRHDRAVRLLSRTRDGIVGVHVVTPLDLPQGGGTVYVDRGWVAQADAQRPDGYARPEGRTIVEGHVRRFAEPGSFTPDNPADSDGWYWLDPAALAARTGDGTATAFYVQAGPDDSGAAPFGSAPDIALRNPHLEYALTWFGVAGALVGVYIAFHIRRRDGNEDSGTA
ncbi:MAG: SURF1 family protein [Alphaproteobacteria bacterium]